MSDISTNRRLGRGYVNCRANQLSGLDARMAKVLNIDPLPVGLRLWHQHGLAARQEKAFSPQPEKRFDVSVQNLTDTTQNTPAN